MTLLEAQDLVCIRGERAVFGGLSFALEAGEALLLAGPNGSGKSSLLRLVAGLLPPAAGRLLWQGTPVSDDAEAGRARLRYVGHQDPVKPVLTVRENLLFWARLQGGTSAAVEPALARFGLAALGEVPGRMLSAGQRRRLNLARLLLVPAPLWLLDEPTVGLDKAAVAALEAVLAEHRAGGGIVLLATHMALRLPGARELTLDRYAMTEAPA
jgi:heme exporter protein A